MKQIGRKKIPEEQKVKKHLVVTQKTYDLCWKLHQGLGMSIKRIVDDALKQFAKGKVNVAD